MALITFMKAIFYHSDSPVTSGVTESLFGGGPQPSSGGGLEDGIVMMHPPPPITFIAHNQKSNGVANGGPMV